MTRLFLLVGLLLTVNLSAQEPSSESVQYFPQQLTAKELLFACASSALTSLGRERRRYCAGFISGVEEAVRLLTQQNSSGEMKKLCLPKNLTARQYKDIYIKYADDHTTDLDQPAARVVIESLKAVFSCAS